MTYLKFIFKSLLIILSLDTITVLPLSKVFQYTFMYMYERFKTLKSWNSFQLIFINSIQENIFAFFNCLSHCLVLKILTKNLASFHWYLSAFIALIMSKCQKWKTNIRKFRSSKLKKQIWQKQVSYVKFEKMVKY